jgi:hypothetical protein
MTGRIRREYGITGLSVAIRIEELSALEKGAELLQMQASKFLA